MTPKSVNRTDFSRLVAEDLNLDHRDVDRVITKAIEVASRTLADGDRLVVRGFGTFEPRVRHGAIRFGSAAAASIGGNTSDPYVRIAFKPAHKLKSAAYAAFHERGELDGSET